MWEKNMTDELNPQQMPAGEEPKKPEETTPAEHVTVSAPEEAPVEETPAQ